MPLLAKRDFLAQLACDQRPICTICLEETATPTTTACGHTFCLRHLRTWLKSSNRCPICRRELYKATESDDNGEDSDDESDDSDDEADSYDGSDNTDNESESDDEDDGSDDEADSYDGSDIDDNEDDEDDGSDDELEHYYFRHFERRIQIRDINWDHHVFNEYDWRLFQSRGRSLDTDCANITEHMNAINSIETLPWPNNLAYISIDQNFLDSVVAAIRWFRPRKLSEFSFRDVCSEEWRRVAAAIFNYILENRGISILGWNFEQNLLEMAYKALNGCHPLYGPLALRLDGKRFKADVKGCVTSIVFAAQCAHMDKVMHRDTEEMDMVL